MGEINSHKKSSITKIFIVITLLTILVYQTLTVRAVDFLVSNADALNNAIRDANNEIQNPGADTITLSSDIILTGTLNIITSEIILNGNGKILDGDSSYRVLTVSDTGNLTINKLTISNGFATNDGGAGILNSGTLTVNFSTITNNSTTITNNFGGGIFNDNGIATINNSTFTNNSALSGGAIHNNGIMNINSSTISGNTVGAGYGGGISNNSGSTLNLSNNTIANNYAGSNQGGGIRNDGFLNYTSTIIADNIGGDCNLGESGEISSSYYNLVEDRSCLPAYHGDPSLDTLDDNGGPTQTHALPSSSIAIDKVPTGGIDQRGAAKDFDGIGDGDTGYEGDIGAYELRETINVGDCIGPKLDGPQTIWFTSGYSVTINVDTEDGINCISVEEMGASHLMASGSGFSDLALQTGNWWHISGNINSGFFIDITLHYDGANDASRVCKWTGLPGGFGWDCGDDADHNPPINGNVTRTNITSFSDWAVGDNVGPTVVTFSIMKAKSTQSLVTLTVTIITTLIAGFVIYKKLKHKIN